MFTVIARKMVCNKFSWTTIMRNNLVNFPIFRYRSIIDTIITRNYFNVFKDSPLVYTGFGGSQSIKTKVVKVFGTLNFGFSLENCKISLLFLKNLQLHLVDLWRVMFRNNFVLKFCNRVYSYLHLPCRVYFYTEQSNHQSTRACT